MIKDIRTFILDSDPYVRNWVALLLARDWRTHYAGEAASIAEFAAFVKSENSNINVVLLDASIAIDDTLFRQYQEVLSGIPRRPLTIMTGMQPDDRALKLLQQPSIAGYLIKDEIQDAIIWAATMATAEIWVVTPSIQDAIFRTGYYPPGKGVVMDGRISVASLSPREKEAARMAFLFSLERHDLADELNISNDWSYGLVSSIYKKLGLTEILEGEVDPSSYLGSNDLLLSHLKDIMAELNGSPKAKDIETLAFHVFTMPEIIAF